MNKIITLHSLNKTQELQYREAITVAFPAIIGESSVIKKYWPKLEQYNPEYQFLLISESEELIGFMNTVPFRFDGALSQLPDRGWDWMLKKGISDFESNIEPNFIGGLQVIVRREFQNLGYSKILLNHAKGFINKSNFENLLIPIRPTKKHEFPAMPMVDYLELRDEKKVYDPWIRTHLNCGAQIIKVCQQSMIMTGNIVFWETMLKSKIYKSGNYKLSGALSLISIDLENDTGEYIEPNIWIKY